MTQNDKQWIDAITFLLIDTDEEIDGFHGYIGMNMELACKLLCVLFENECHYLLDTFLERMECGKFFLC